MQAGCPVNESFGFPETEENAILHGHRKGVANANTLDELPKL